jgi:hypothetical protein
MIVSFTVIGVFVLESEIGEIKDYPSCNCLPEWRTGRFCAECGTPISTIKKRDNTDDLEKLRMGFVRNGVGCVEIEEDKAFLIGLVLENSDDEVDRSSSIPLPGYPGVLTQINAYLRDIGLPNMHFTQEHRIGVHNYLYAPDDDPS